MDCHHHVALSPRLPIIRKGLPVESVGSSAINPKNSRVRINLGFTLLNRFTAFLTHNFGNLFYILFDEAGILFQNTHLFVKGNSIPLLLSFNSKRNGPVQIF